MADRFGGAARLSGAARRRAAGRRLGHGRQSAGRCRLWRARSAPAPAELARGAGIGARLSPLAAPPGPLRALWRAFVANRSALAGAIVILLLLVIALAAPLLAPH